MRLFERSGITSARLARHELAWAGLSTSETRLRPLPSQSLFDYVLMIEAISRKTLARESSSAEELLLAAGSTSVELGCYDLQFQLYG